MFWHGPHKGYEILARQYVSIVRKQYNVCAQQITRSRMQEKKYDSMELKILLLKADTMMALSRALL